MVHGKRYDAGLRTNRKDLSGGFNAIHHRHGYIDDRYIGTILLRVSDSLLAIGCQRDNLYISGRFQNISQAVADHEVVVRQENSNHMDCSCEFVEGSRGGSGMRTSIFVPFSGVDCTLRVPSSASARSCMIFKPWLRGRFASSLEGMPVPLSSMVKQICFSSNRRERIAWLACAWRAMLVSASWLIRRRVTSILLSSPRIGGVCFSN